MTWHLLHSLPIPRPLLLHSIRVSKFHTSLANAPSHKKKKKKRKKKREREKKFLVFSFRHVCMWWITALASFFILVLVDIRPSSPERVLFFWCRCVILVLCKHTNMNALPHVLTSSILDYQNTKTQVCSLHRICLCPVLWEQVDKKIIIKKVGGGVFDGTMKQDCKNNSLSDSSAKKTIILHFLFVFNFLILSFSSTTAVFVAESAIWKSILEELPSKRRSLIHHWVSPQDPSPVASGPSQKHECGAAFHGCLRKPKLSQSQSMGNDSVSILPWRIVVAGKSFGWSRQFGQWNTALVSTLVAS